MTNDLKQRVTIFMNPYIAKHARAQAVVEEITFTNIVEKALVQYLPKKTVIKRVGVDRRKSIMRLGVDRRKVL